MFFAAGKFSLSFSCSLAILYFFMVGTPVVSIICLMVSGGCHPQECHGYPRSSVQVVLRLYLPFRHHSPSSFTCMVHKLTQNSSSDSSLLGNAPSKPIQKHILQQSSISKISVYNVSFILFMSDQYYNFVTIFTFFLCFSYHRFILPSMFFLLCW